MSLEFHIPPHDLTRRGLMTLGCVAMVTACVGRRGAQVETAETPGDPNMTTPNALAGTHTIVPLPFAPSSLVGLSEAMIKSHHENNYASAIDGLNQVEQDLSNISPDTPGYMVASLRERELTFRNSKTLHELYFGNLGGDGKRSGAIEKALGDAYGAVGRWEEQMRATGMGLGGGSGWAILGYELETGALRTFGSFHHTQTLALSMPLLVMDMYEHAYQMDFGAAVARYIDAFFANVNWDEVNRRLERAQLMHGNFKKQ